MLHVTGLGTCQTGNMPDWDIDEMQLMQWRHSKCLKHSNKNWFCIISFFSFASVFWNISWLTAICSAFEGFSLKRGIAVLVLPQTQKNALSALGFFYSHQHPSLVRYMSHQVWCSLQCYRLLLAKQIKGTSVYLPVYQLS